MGDIKLNTTYLKTNRGIIKIVQIVLGFIICSLLCGAWFGGSYCFNEGRLGGVSAGNFIIVIINIVFFFLNLLSLKQYQLEKIYSIIAAIFFLIASCIMVWYLIDRNTHGHYIGATVLVIVELLLFVWDIKILQGESSNY